MCLWHYPEQVTAELLFLHKRSSLPTLAGAAGEWKHEKVFKSFVYYFVFAHANNFTNGSSVCCDFVLCSVKYLH